MSLKQNYVYVAIKSLPSLQLVEVKNIESFVRLTDFYEATCMLTVNLEEDLDDANAASFCFITKEANYMLPANGYKTLDDYSNSFLNGFPDAINYYEARKLNFTIWKEYEICKKSGTIDKTLFVKAQKLGFIDTFPDFITKLNDVNWVIPKDIDKQQLDTPLKIYDFAIAQGFKDQGDFAKAFFLGYSNRTLYEEAQKKGFIYATDYISAVSMGFTVVREYQEAKHAGINSKAEYDKYDYLKKSAGVKYSFDQTLLVNALKVYENGKKLSLKKIEELIKDLKAGYFIDTEEEKKELPKWFTQKLTDHDIIAKFLSVTEDLKAFGIFNNDGEYFEISRLETLKVFIDASNVAYANHHNDSGYKPTMQNVKLIIDELKAMRFSDIIIIADASLKHKVIDKGLIDVIRKEVQYYEAPANSTADQFLIENAKKDKCYILTNDTFRDWKQKDPCIPSMF